MSDATTTSGAEPDPETQDDGPNALLGVAGPPRIEDTCCGLCWDAGFRCYVDQVTRA